MADRAMLRGDLASAERLFTEAIAIMEEVGDKQQAGALTGSLADIAMQRGDLASAERLNTEAQDIMREVGDKRNAGALLGKLADIAMQRGDLASAERLYRESMAIDEEVGDRRGLNVSKTNLALVLIQKGDREAGCALLAEAHAEFTAMGLPEADQVAGIMAQVGCGGASAQPPAPEGMDPQLWQLVLQMAQDQAVAEQVYAQLPEEQAAQLRALVEQIRGGLGGTEG
ncbi:MAG: tetratricopeptide repeat protein [Anaerolineae bacterium]